MSNVPPSNQDPNSYPAGPGANPYQGAPANAGYSSQPGPGSFPPNQAANPYSAPHGGPRRASLPGFLTPEFFVFIVVSLTVLIAAAVVDNGEDGQGFGVDKAWLYVTILAVGYMISRGLAKSGSHSRHHSDH